MSVKITPVEGMKLKAEYHGLEIISGRVNEDAPLEGMSPGKLMAASIGLCTGMHVVVFLMRQGISNDGFEVTMEQVNAENPRRCGAFTTYIHVRGELTDEQREALLAEANRCYVGNTLRESASIDVCLKAES